MGSCASLEGSLPHGSLLCYLSTSSEHQGLNTKPKLQWKGFERAFVLFQERGEKKENIIQTKQQRENRHEMNPGN